MILPTDDLKPFRIYFGLTLIQGVLALATLGLVLRFVLGYFFQ